MSTDVTTVKMYITRYSTKSLSSISLCLNQYHLICYPSLSSNQYHLICYLVVFAEDSVELRVMLAKLCLALLAVVLLKRDH